jgi:hypothetical protein
MYKKLGRGGAAASADRRQRRLIGETISNVYLRGSKEKTKKKKRRKKQYLAGKN